MSSAYEASDEVVAGRLVDGATMQTIAEDYELTIRDRTPGCRGHLNFAAEEDWFAEGSFFLVTGAGRTIGFRLFKPDGEAWEGIVDSDAFEG